MAGGRLRKGWISRMDRRLSRHCTLKFRGKGCNSRVAIGCRYWLLYSTWFGSQNMKAKQLHPTLVMKFGGTSVGSAEAILRCSEIIRTALQDWPRTVVVVSALSGVTNVAPTLIPDKESLEQLSGRTSGLISEFCNLCSAINILGESTPRALDAVASLGERLSSRLIAAALNCRGIPSEAVEATRLIVTDSHFQAAHPDLVETRRNVREVLNPILDKKKVPVVTGFIGASKEGILTTLGRGGSDYSAAILAAALYADQVWIWTDVDGVMSADPRLVPEARTIPKLSYRETAELAYFGAKVVHPKTIRPVIEAGIGLSIKNTFNPTHPGTELIPEGEIVEGQTIKAVTAISGQTLMTVEGRGMLGVPGVAARAFGSVAATGTNVILISQASSEQSITFAVPSKSGELVRRALEETFAAELQDRDIDRIWCSDEAVIVTVVGSGMRHTPGVAGRVFSALGENGINVIAIAQGSSEVAISLVVDNRDRERAVRVLHGLTT